ncbi:MAG TPA: alpha/beta hydrolase [Gemmatimonadales bacterium]|jgi:pimeloyl-ACP methyl ester carboxylesterase
MPFHRAARTIAGLATVSIWLCGCHAGRPRTPQGPRAAFANVNGVRLQYLDYGGTGDGLVFIHGLGDSPHAWDDIAPSFTSRFHVIAYARRGHGRSDAHGPWDHVTLSEDLHLLLDTLHIQRAVVVGWSLGGYEITEFAAAYPERTLGLICLECYDLALPGFRHLIETSPPSADPTAADLAGTAAFRAWFKRTSAPMDAFTPAMEAEIADVSVRRADGSLRLVTDDSISAALIGMATSFHPPYAAVKAPMLAVFGRWYARGMTPPGSPDSVRVRADQFLIGAARPFQDSMIAELRTKAPAARIVILDSATHATFPWSKRDTIVALMKQFLWRSPWAARTFVGPDQNIRKGPSGVAR